MEGIATAAVRQLATLVDIADGADWWPAPLRVQIPEGKTEQEVYAGLLRADPSWAAKLRAASVDLVARLAWDDIQTVRPELTATREKLAASQLEVSSLEKRAKEAQGRLSATKLGLDSTRVEIERLRKELREATVKSGDQALEIARMQSSGLWRISERLKRIALMLRQGKRNEHGGLPPA